MLLKSNRIHSFYLVFALMIATGLSSNLYGGDKTYCYDDAEGQGYKNCKNWKEHCRGKYSFKCKRKDTGMWDWFKCTDLAASYDSNAKAAVDLLCDDDRDGSRRGSGDRDCDEAYRKYLEFKDVEGQSAQADKWRERAREACGDDLEDLSASGGSSSSSPVCAGKVIEGQCVPTSCLEGLRIKRSVKCKKYHYLLTDKLKCEVDTSAEGKGIGLIVCENGVNYIPHHHGVDYIGVSEFGYDQPLIYESGAADGETRSGSSFGL